MAFDGRTRELQASIRNGDLHLYIVRENDGKDCEVVHLGQLVYENVQTCIRFTEADPTFITKYPKASLVWLALKKDGWDVRPVTTMDERAQREYQTAKAKLFGTQKVTKSVTLDSIELSGRNPRKKFGHES